jgi:hypothetical protein
MTAGLVFHTDESLRDFRRGVVDALDASGLPVVRQGDGQAAIVCDLLDTGSGVPAVGPGDMVVFFVPADTPDRGCVLGVIRRVPAPPAAAAPHAMAAVAPSVEHIVASRVVLEGKDEVVLKTPRASIVIRADGDIEILAGRVVSRARTLIKLLAPMLRLN